MPKRTRNFISPDGHWRISTSKGAIMESRCQCSQADKSKEENEATCNLCRYTKELAELPNLPEEVYADNVLVIEHDTSGTVIEVKPHQLFVHLLMRCDSLMH
eukprot:m.76944 g.76944  ORF g.76944 m.76944 type:complete len:102 (-) comp12592_c0_seq3:680-985(-)